jgi:hypothetical protein
MDNRQRDSMVLKGVEFIKSLKKRKKSNETNIECTKSLNDWRKNERIERKS